MRTFKFWNDCVSWMNELGGAKQPFYFQISFDKSHSLVCKLSELDNNELNIQFPSFQFPEKSSPLNQSVKTNSNGLLKSQPMAFDDYKIMFHEVVEQICMGNSYLLNLTCKTPIKTTEPLDDIYYRAKAKYKILYKDQFVCFSPEPFVRIVNNSIYTYPMKGTCNPRIRHAKAKLLADKKETAEHYTIVDLLRNDLSKVSASVRVEKFRFFETIETNQGQLLQTSSKIHGILKPDWHRHLGDIFDKILPAGSICGAPKEKTVEIIQAVEKYKRGYYTGVAGYFSGTELDSCVMIRFIENENGVYFYKSGGGITSQSEPRLEYDEMIKKIYVPIR